MDLFFLAAIGVGLGHTGRLAGAAVLAGVGPDLNTASSAKETVNQINRVPFAV